MLPRLEECKKITVWGFMFKERRQLPQLDPLSLNIGSLCVCLGGWGVSPGQHKSLNA